MIKRLFICLIHPSKIGLFIKDKLWIPITYFLSFFLVTASILAIRGFMTDYFIDSSADIVNMVYNVNKDINVSYKNNELTGDSITIYGEDYVISFFNTNSGDIGYINLNFSKEYVRINYLFNTKVINYEDINLKYDFNINNIQKGNSDDLIAFKIFLNNIFDSFLKTYQTAIYFSDLLYVFFILIALIFILILVSYFTNPGIDFNCRIKLIIYDSLIYFFFLYLAIAVGYNLFMYIGMLFPAFYSVMTFSHIIKVRIRR